GVREHRAVDHVRGGAGGAHCEAPAERESTIAGNSSPSSQAMAEDLSALIAARLKALSPTVLEIDDDSAEHAGHAGAAAGGGHFSLLVVSEQFRSRSKVQRHQLVYERLRDLMPHRIHALSIRALAPEEF